MANIVIPFAAVSHQPVPSVGFNNNFTEVATKFNTYAVQTDVAKVIAVAHTFSVAQNMAGLAMTGDLLFTDALYDIGKVGATRPRNGFFSGSLTIGGGLNLSAGQTIAADTFITPAAGTMLFRIAGFGSVLDLTNAPSLIPHADGNMSLGDVTHRWTTLYLNGTAWIPQINFNVAAGKIIPGVTSVSHRNNADSADNLLILDSGQVVLRTDLKFASASGRFLPGVTQVSFRNNADTFDNVTIADNGSVTVRASLTTGGAVIAPITSTSGSFHAIPTASDPAISTTDGDIWILTSGAFKAKLNGAVRTLWHSGQISAGYAAWTGTLNRATVLDQSTATLAQVAQRLAAIQNDLMTAGILST